MASLSLLVPSRETATPEIISDVMPVIFSNTKDSIIKEHGREAGQRYQDIVQEIYDQVPVAGRGASYTGDIGLPASVVEQRRKMYGDFLDLSGQFRPIMEEENRRFMDYESDPCAVCEGNRIMATGEHGACNCPSSVTNTRLELDKALMDLPPSKRAAINEIVDRYVHESYDYGRDTGFDSGRESGFDYGSRGISFKDGQSLYNPNEQDDSGSKGMRRSRRDRSRTPAPGGVTVSFR